jgi:beta-lactamase regulating signal transducer with metallopeptidase domain
MDIVVEGRWMTVPAAAWLGFVVDVAVRGTAIAGAAWLVALVLERAPAAPASVRSRLWTMVFVLLFLLPLVSVLSPLIPLPATAPRLELPVSIIEVLPVTDKDGVPAPGETAAGAQLRSPVIAESGARSAAADSRGVSRGVSRARLTVSPGVVRLAVLVWLLVSVALTVRTVRRLRAGSAIARSARPAGSGILAGAVRDTKRRLGIRRPVDVRVGGVVAAPFVSGLFRQRLYLPGSALSWNLDELCSVLMHELAHVRRRDLVRLVLIEVATAIHWFNPLVWRAARRANLEFEMACDDVACDGGGSPVDYARQLVYFAGRAAGAARAPGMAARPGLEYRVRNIIHPGDNAPLGRTRRWLAFVVTGLLALVMLIPVSGLRTAGPPAGRGIVTAAADVSKPADNIAYPRRTIHEAAAAGDVESINRLIASDPGFVNAVDERNMTPVALAAWNDRLAAVARLIELGADVDRRNHNGLTPLFCALDRGRPDMARLLLAGGADPFFRGYRGRTMLHMAARTGDAGMIRTLVSRGLDVNATDIDGYTPLDVAGWRPAPAIHDLLAGFGARTSGLAPPRAYKPKSRKTV